jgi:Ca2+-binding RTX toxin-like protein
MSMSETGLGATNGGVTWDPLAEITHETVVQGCDCVICKGLREEALHGKKGTTATTDPVTDANPEGNPLGVLLNLTTNPDGSRSFTGNRNVDATLIGSKWGTQELTYSFPTAGSNYNGSTPLNAGVDRYHLDLGTLQQQAARSAFAQISAATNMKFTEITETDTNHANIRISQTADNDVGSAYGGFPSEKQSAAGDIWFGRTNQPYYDLASKGTWGYATMLHEIGHTMGLKHGHQDYTNSDLSFYFGTAPRFGSQSLTPDRDGQAWSLMTYTPAPGTGGFAGEKINQPQTYMQYDLAALQYMYGANYTTNATDSVYTFSQTTGEMFINGIGQGAPSGNKIFATIWDGGGNDTIDASNYANGVSIDLRPGEFSTVDPAQLANNTAYQNLTNLAPGNIAMSLLYNNDARSLIENAKGGAGNDVFVGNTANNVLDGGAGSDTVVFTNTTGVNVTLNDTGADVIVTHDGETDTLRSIENIQGTVGNDTLIGNSQNNILSGGASGNDTLSGGAGDDRLIGGGFTTTTVVSAPSQPDITKPQSTNNGSIATAVATAGAFDVDANPDITNSTTLPHATINATAAGGSLEYYRIDVTVPGSQAIFDIDGPGSLDDSFIELVNSNGQVIASNDTGAGDPSYPGHDDAYLTYTFQTPGTYFIRVGLWNGAATAQPLIAGQTYQLNISLTNSAVLTTTTTATNNSSLIADGGEGNDFIAGTLGNDVLNGGSGNDTASFAQAFNGGTRTGVTVDLNIQGTAQDTVAAGRDTLTGIENLIGSALNDTLIGNADANVIEGGLGDDTLIGGAGNDTASYAGATTGVTVSLFQQNGTQNTIGAGIDTLSGFQNLLGSAFNDTLTGDANENTITGGAGNDTLSTGGNAGGTIDLLDGGAGSDTASFAGYNGGVVATLRNAMDGIASMIGVAPAPNMQIASLRSIENLTGGGGNDVLTGDDGANVIEGGLGDDTLVGGAGNDTVAFTGTTGVTINLGLTSAQNTGYGNDTISGFENVRTTMGDDTVIGDANDNIIFDGGGGLDNYDGGAGSDTVDYTNTASNVVINLNLATQAALIGAAAGDTLTNIENINGSLVGINNLTGGNTTDNRLVGGAAADRLIGGGMNDTLIGGAGNDVIFGDYVDTFSTVAGAADGNDTLEGGAGNDILIGGLGNDTLRGGDGDDTLVGGIGNATTALTAVYTNDGGNDTFDGGDGTDTAYAYYTGRAGGVSFDLGNLDGNSAITLDGANIGSFTSVERVIFRGGTGNDVVRGGGTLDTLVGNEGDDILDGWYGNDTLSGGLGNDTLIGGEGLDTATYVNATAGVNVDLRIQGTAQDTGGEGIDTLSGIEYLTGSSFGDTLRGNDEFNLIIDNAVATTATAGQTDALYGYGGDDSILVTRASGTVSTNIIMDGGDGNDIIELRSGALTAAPVAVADGLSTATYLSVGATGDRNADNVTVDAGAGNDRIILTGVASATVNAGSGNDTLSISMRGGAGVNNYQLTLGAGADVVQLAGTGAETTTTARSSRITDFDRGNTGDRFEMTAFLNGGLTGYTANSNAFASGHLRLVQSGTDLLLQSDRDGTGTSNDFVTLFAISNGYTGGFTAFNFDGFIGNLTLTGFDANETITGATGNDVLSGGGGDDMLYGLAGNDTLNGGDGNDLLDGGTGVDTMAGGMGDDRYVIDNVGDQIIEFAGGGTDTVSSSVSYTLSANVEALLLTGTGAINATGNDENNYILGNAGRNTLSGGAGYDTLVTVTGNAAIKPDAGFDRIDGGDGVDTLMLGGFKADYQLLTTGDRTFLVTARSAVEVAGVEQGAFLNTSVQSFSDILSNATSFSALSYIAGYSDLRAAFGTDSAAGAQHFANYGFAEGRGLAFNALNYIASYSDLRAAYGTNVEEGAQHYIMFGAGENRSTTFDAWKYLASYGDLIETFGSDEAAAARHFIQFGANENRAITFNAEAYAAANADVAAAFGNDAEALARHYVQYGFAEGRSLGGSTSAAAPATIAAAFVDSTDQGDGAIIGDALPPSSSGWHDDAFTHNQHITIA